jgi:alcohol dehydrogenase
MSDETGTELRKFVAPEFVYGRGAVRLVGRYARNFGAHKALVVTDPGVIRAGWAEMALTSLDSEGIPWEVFQGVSPNPREYEVAAGVDLYHEAECDIIVAVGGGSPMDCAKGIGIAHTNNADILTFEGVDEVPMPGPPLICVPTTAGSAADVSQFAIINDTSRKLKIAIISKTVVPDVALIDPATTTTMSAELTAATALDALTHAIEAYTSNANSPVTDLNALAAMPLLTRNVVSAIENPGNMQVRNSIMLGSLLAGMAFSNAGLGLVHAMAHSLGGLLDLPHGMCNALLLDHVTDFNYAVTPERYRRIAHEAGTAASGPGSWNSRQSLLKGMAALREECGLPATLGEVGVNHTDVPRLAANAYHDPCLATNARPARVEEIESLYDEAL